MTSPAEPNHSYFVTEAASSRKSRTLKGFQPLNSLRSQPVENILDMKKMLPIFRSGFGQFGFRRLSTFGDDMFSDCPHFVPFLSLSVMTDDNAHNFVKLLLPKAISKSIILK
jgi:hypothetical protein